LFLEKEKSGHEYALFHVNFEQFKDSSEFKQLLFILCRDKFSLKKRTLFFLKSEVIVKGHDTALIIVFVTFSIESEKPFSWNFYCKFLFAMISNDD
jgi:hypothetical protein